MENNNSSMTALVCLFARAYHSLYDSPKIFNDYLARQFLTDEEFLQISEHMANGLSFFCPGDTHKFSTKQEALKWVVQTQLAATTLARARYCEEILKNEIQSGIRQYVILGAGMDTFAFRNTEILKKIDVFEVDYPATQQFKIDRIKVLNWKIPERLHFIPIDFNTDDLKIKIKQSSYNSSGRTFFSWLGVVYYLSKEDILQMLKIISSIATKGSLIVFDYADENLFNKDTSSKRIQNMVSMVKTAGEPMKSSYSYSEIETVLEQAGFRIHEHLSPEKIEKRYFQDRTDYLHAVENTNFILGAVK